MSPWARWPLVGVALLWLPPLSAASVDIFTHSLGDAAQRQQGQLQPVPGAGLRAFSLAVVQRLLPVVPQPAVIREVPLMRAVQLLALPQPVLVFSLFRTPARAPLYRWIGPLHYDDGVFYQAPQRPLGQLTPARLRQLPVCAVRGGAYDEYLQAQGFARIELAPSYATCLRMLVAGRVQLTVVARSDLAAKLREAGLHRDQVSDSGQVLMRADSYIAASLATPPALVAAWNQALRQLQASPEYEALRQRYLPPHDAGAAIGIDPMKYQAPLPPAGRAP